MRTTSLAWLVIGLFLSVPLFTAAGAQAEETFTVAVKAGKGGIVTPSAPKPIEVGASQVFTITPDIGYHIVSVKVDGKERGALTSVSVQDDLLPNAKKHSIKAKFKVNRYEVAGSVIGTGGKVTPTGAKQFKHGKKAMYTIKPDKGYRIYSVAVNGVPRAGLPESGLYKLPLVVTEDTTIEAMFTPAPAKLVAGPATGLWEGTFTDQNGFVYDILAVISPDNRASIFAPLEGTQYAGSLKFNGNNATGSFTGYAPEGYLFYNGKPVTTGTVSLVVDEKNSITGSYNAAADSGTISLVYNPYLEKPSSLLDIEGRWGYALADEWLDLIIDIDGTFNATDDAGCQYTGSLQLPSSAWNIYGVSMQVTACGTFNGTYAGLTFKDSDIYGDYLVYMVANGKYSLFNTLDRQ